MSEWNVTFTDGEPPFVILKNVPAGATEADVRKEISQQPNYKGRKIASAIDLSNASTTPAPITSKPEESPKKKKKTPPDPGYKPPVYNQNADPGSKESIRQPDGTYRVDIFGTNADPVKPPSSNSGNGRTSPDDDVINNVVKKQEEAENAKKAAAEAEKKARKTKEEDDQKAALKAQEEATRKKIEAENAKKAAEQAEKDQTIDSFRKDGEQKADAEAKEKADNAKKTNAEKPVTNSQAEKPVTTSQAEKPAGEPSKEPEGPGLWDKIKNGAEKIGQAISGAVTPNPTPSKEEIEAKLKELENSRDETVRQEAKKQRDKLNGQSDGPGTGAKVSDTGTKPGGGGNSDIGKTTGTGNGTGPGNGTKPGDGTGPGTAPTAPTGTTPGPGTSSQGAPGTGNKPGVTPAPNNADVDADRVRKERRIQDAELEKLRQEKERRSGSKEAGHWVNVGFGIVQWKGAPGKDPAYGLDRLFVDGDVMPKSKYSTGVGNSTTTTYSGNGGTDKMDRQALDKLLLDKEVANQELIRLRKELGVNEDFDRILKLAGLDK